MVMLEKTRSRSKINRKKGKSNEEQEHLSKVAQLGCIICGSPANIHHIRTGQGLSQRSSHFETIPLCYNHHQGRDGIHTIGTKTWQKIYGSEKELLEKVKAKIKEEMKCTIL